MDSNDSRVGRRSFLRKSAVAPIGVAGWAAQDEPERSRYTRRMALRYPERLGDEIRRKIVLLTDRTDDDPDVSEVDTCGFSNWPPERLTVWEGILVEWEPLADAVVNFADVGELGGFFGANPEVRAEQLVERERIFVDEQDTPVDLGTPYIVNGIQECPGEFLGLTATQLPGIDIRTGPGVSTDG
ncbi:hypothetical protein [Halorussus aquaticus]|uniref:Tat (Twin-arginine translocation) pathway signal sequence n=1 Tax=Halorussus aquaticus TaxID=2953748 RepID=A0ABD5PYS4_9EURY|nr:hypothetical protein [Halorussus aquaticus]